MTNQPDPLGCVNCGHALAHHGHYQYRGKPGCKCSGWSKAGE